MSRLEKVLLLINLLTYLAIFVFSYAYVDLNLTLSQNHSVLNAIGSLQQLGYFHRPQATLIYLLILLVSYLFFAVEIYLVFKKKVGKKFIITSTILTTLLLILAYPFLSYDIFNYIFDAKIIFHYHLSPYTHNALDFPQDTWTRFMHWTQRYTPYGPLWLGFSLIPTILGLGRFTLTLFVFKVFIGIFHLVNAFLIYKILQKIKPVFKLVGTATYALNPLLLLEGVANAHNDVILATFLLLSVYLLVREKKLFAIGANIVGVFIKYIPILIIPWMLIYVYRQKLMSLRNLIVLSLVTMAAFTYWFSSFKIVVPFVSAGATQVQFQPWYLFWTLPFAALLPEIWLIALTSSFSIGALLRYLPYLYYGDWSHSGTIQFMTLVTIIPAVLVIVTIGFTKALKFTKNNERKI